MFLAKTFKLFLATAPAAHYTVVPLCSVLFRVILYGSVLFWPESGRIGMATNHGQLLNGLLSENYGTPKAHKAFTMPRPGQRRLVTFFIVVGLRVLKLELDVGYWILDVAVTHLLFAG